MIYEWQPTNEPAAPAAQPTAAQMERRRRYALRLCRNALNKTSWVLADKLAKLWECEGCKTLGVDEPEEHIKKE